MCSKLFLPVYHYNFVVNCLSIFIISIFLILIETLHIASNSPFEINPFSINGHSHLSDSIIKHLQSLLTFLFTSYSICTFCQNMLLFQSVPTITTVNNSLCVTIISHLDYCSIFVTDLLTSTFVCSLFST